MQVVLPKQAPDAAETNGKRGNIERYEKEKSRTKKKIEAELCWSNSAVQVELSDKTFLFI